MSTSFQIYVRPGEDGAYVIEASFNGEKQHATSQLPRNFKKAAQQLADAVATGANVRGTAQPGGRKRLPNPDDRIMQELGGDLFRFLFQRGIYALFQDAVKTAGTAPVRLSLTIQSRDLAQLPWETLCDPDTLQYLATVANMPFARGLDAQIPIVAAALPIRILFMIATPEELDGRRLAAINDDEEWVGIKKALGRLEAEGKVELRRVVSGDRNDLIRAASAGYDIFHFIGHGDVDVQGQGYLVFTEDGKFGRRVDAGDLRDCLDNIVKTPRLAVLNACKSASSVGRDLYRNTAQTLAGRIPAVIGMQYDFTFAAASSFSETFYGALAGAFPIQEALRQARLVLRGSGPEWITPVLYFSGDDGVLAHGAGV